MSAASDVVDAYFEAWNDHDTDAILATFHDGGTCSDPARRRRLAGGRDCRLRESQA